MRAVFDLDDTICVHTNRDYPNAKPIEAVIEKMRQMKKDGWEIVIYSARGQVSCKGDLALIEERNRAVVETWLRQHDVPYDALVFGKPIGDIYVDDKGLSLVDFIEKPFYEMQGGSGQSVFRIGDTVKKHYKTAEECAAFKAWTAANNGLFRCPQVRSYLYEDVYMDYISGGLLADAEHIDIEAFMGLWRDCKSRRADFDIAKQVDVLERNKTGQAETDVMIEAVAADLLSVRGELAEKGSFCHGDMILSNIIDHGGTYYYIDPRYIEGASSYLLDMAKLRMSMQGYERLFGLSLIDHAAQVPELDECLKAVGDYDYVMALEIMYILRLLRYRPAAQDVIIEFAKKELDAWIG